MKRIPLVVLVVLVLVLGITSCAPTTSTTPAPKPTPQTQQQQAIPWDKAKYHIGDRTTVYGPVVDTAWASGSKGKPTFLNIGKRYPDPERFTVVIWIQNRGNFPQAPESYYLGKTIYVTGMITEYKGTPQIEVKGPSQIEEQ